MKNHPGTAQEYFSSLSSAMASDDTGGGAVEVESRPGQQPAEVPVPTTPAPTVVVPAAAPKAPAPVQSGATPGDAVMETPDDSTGLGEPSNENPVPRPMRGLVCLVNVQHGGPKYDIYIYISFWPPRWHFLTARKSKFGPMFQCPIKFRHAKYHPNL